MKRLLVTILILLFPMNTSTYAISQDDKDAVLGNYPFYDASSLGGTCTGGAFNLSGSNNLEIVWNYFLSRNFTEEQAAGIIGNLLVETAGTLDPRIRQGGDFITDPYDPSGPKGRGIAQWTFSQRWQVLLDYAEAQDRDPLSLDLQLDFIMFEMTGTPPAIGVPGGRWSGAYEKLIATTTVEDAAVTFARYYEVNQLSIDFANGLIGYEEAFRYRIDPAEDVYLDLAGTGVTGITCGPGGGVVFDIIEGDTTEIPCQGNVLGDEVAIGYSQGVAYNIRICEIALPGGGAGPWVNSQISGAMSAMFESAYVSGVRMDGGGFRTMESQIQARIRNGCPDIYTSPASSCRIPTARPGYSNHQMGFAIDFNGVAQCPSSIQINGKDFCQDPGDPTWDWLKANAGKFGLLQLSTEAWHWSIDGG